MARVYVYERPVDSVLMNVTFYEQLNQHREEIQIKEEPRDTDDDIQSGTFTPNTNVTSVSPGGSTVLETQSMDYVNNKENKPALSEDSTDTGSSKIEAIKKKHKRLKFENLKRQNSSDSFKKVKLLRFSSNTIDFVQCDICFLHFQTAIALKYHVDYYNISSDRGCGTCNLLCKSRDMLEKHKRKSTCKKAVRRSGVFYYLCNFCERQFQKKRNLQGHLFHVHSNVIFGPAKGKISEVLLTQGTNSDITDSSLQQKEKNLSSLPVKKMRQTTIVEFLQRATNKKELIYTEKVNFQKKLPKKVIPKQNRVLNSFFRNPEENKLINHKLINHENSRPNTDSSNNKGPFVEMHVDPNMILSLLENKVETEVGDLPSDSILHNTSYNLRRIPRQINQSLTDLDMSPILRSSKRIHSTTTSKYGQNNCQLTEQKLNDKFKTKECSVYLIRCDIDTREERPVANELQSLPMTEVKIKEDKEFNSIEQNSKKNTKLKRIEVPLVRINSLLKCQQVNQLLTSPQKSSTVQGNIQNMFQCKICKNSFSTKQNLHKHLELHHVFYISSICNARSKAKNVLLKHYLYQHFSFKRMECCVCFEKFKSRVLLQQHMVLHCIRVIEFEEDESSITEVFKCNAFRKTNKCNACGKRFWLKSCLSEHRNVCQKMKVKMENEHCTPYMKTSSAYLNNEACETFNSADSSLHSLPTVSPNKELSILSQFVSQSQPVEQKKTFLKGVAFVKGYNIDNSTSDKSKFPCTVCNIQFHTFQNLCLHTRTYSKPSVYICQTCDTAFPTKRILQNHVSSTHSLNKLQEHRYFCMFCTQGFLKKGRLQIHVGHFHAGQTPIVPKSWVDSSFDSDVNGVCSICNLMFESNERFIEHSMYYYKGQMFTCTFCNQIFHGMYMLNHHNKQVHYPEDRRKSYNLVCKECNEGFNQESHLHAHRLHVHLNRVTYRPSCPQVNSVINVQDHTYALVNKSHAARSFLSTKFTCNICYMNFLREKDLHLHKLEYTNSGDFLCSYCPRKFVSDVILTRHENLCHGNSNFNKTYTCRSCGEVLSTAINLKSHEYHFHEKDTNVDSDNNTTLHSNTYFVKSENNDGQFSCTTCSMNFYNQDKLNYHLQEYLNVGRYNCETCNRKFPELYLLEIHMLKHSNLNFMLCKHRCPICQEGFSSAMNVRAHIMHVHNRMKGLKAMIEQKTNSSMDDLNYPTNESSTLSKRSAFKCNVCSMSFETMYSLKRHESRVSNTGEHVCESCGRKFLLIERLKEHKKKHTIYAQRLRYSCPDCDEKFGNVISQYQHIVHLHGKEKWSGKIPNVKSCHGIKIHGARSKNDEANKVPTINIAANNESRTTENPVNVSNDTSQKGQVKDSKDKVLSYICPVCSVKFPSLKLFQLHFKADHKMVIQGTSSAPLRPDSENPVSCIICKLTFFTEDELKQHAAKPHVQVKPTNMEDAPCITTQKNPGAMQVVCDKNSETAEQLGGQSVTDDSPVYVFCQSNLPCIIKYESDASSEKSNEEASSNCSKLKIKDFAKMT